MFNMVKVCSGDAFYRAYCGLDESADYSDVRIADALAYKWSYDGIASVCICFPYEYGYFDSSGFHAIREGIEDRCLRVYSYGEELWTNA